MKWFKMTRDDNKTVTLPLIEGADVVELPSQSSIGFTLDNTPVNFPKNTPIFLGKLYDNVQYVDYSDNFKTALSQYFKLLDFDFFKNHVFKVDDIHKITFGNDITEAITFEFQPSGVPSVHTFYYTFGYICGTIPYYDDILGEMFHDEQRAFSAQLRIHQIGSDLDTPMSVGATVSNKKYYPSTVYYQNTQFNAFWHNVDDDVFVDQPTDPYTPSGDGETPTHNTDPENSGGTGNFDAHSDNIVIPGINTLPDIRTKNFIKIYTPTDTELYNLSAYLWGNTFDISQLKKLFANPFDTIISLSLVPVTIPTAGTTTVKIGNIDSGISVAIAGQQYVDVDCGYIDIAEYWGAYLDYAPYTKIDLFLPFIGYKTLNTDEIMRGKLYIKYRIDILTGACVAFLYNDVAVLYQYVGNCSLQIPITAADYTQTIQSLLSLANTGINVLAGGVVGGVRGGVLNGVVQTVGNLANQSGAILSDIANTKPTIERSGGLTTFAGLLGLQKPYLTITRPKATIPENQNRLMGYPSQTYVNFSQLSGFTVLENCNFKGGVCTDNEKQEILNLLYQGVIF